MYCTQWLSLRPITEWQSKFAYDYKWLGSEADDRAVGTSTDDIAGAIAFKNA